MGEQKKASLKDQPAEIQQIVQSIKQWNKRIRQINDRCKKIKDEENFSEVASNLRDAKEKLYQFLDEQKMEKIDEYSKEWCAPPSVKKERRDEKRAETMKERIKGVLPTIDEEKFEELIEKLSI
jgi:septal ring factor EnvC (AmiA/AmiB activator)